VYEFRIVLAVLHILSALTNIRISNLILLNNRLLLLLRLIEARAARAHFLDDDLFQNGEAAWAGVGRRDFFLFTRWLLEVLK
jgi:hypothetical protein